MKEYFRLMLGFYNVMNNEDYYKAMRYQRLTIAALFVIWLTLLVTLLLLR